MRWSAVCMSRSGWRWWFYSARGTSALSVTTRLKRFRRIRFHDLRHSTATLLLEQGVDLVVIKEVLGHAHIGVTAGVYAHVRLRLQHQAIDTLATPSARRTTTPTSRPPHPLSADVAVSVAVKRHMGPARKSFRAGPICIDLDGQRQRLTRNSITRRLLGNVQSDQFWSLLGGSQSKISRSFMDRFVMSTPESRRSTSTTAEIPRRPQLFARQSNRSTSPHK
ncbi:tyrosine-type recombinase/integrase [Streptomyces sp. NRRL F-4474]|uniref:tyrosine-type recombinase/integrase n=1 Tax=Streptomyces sp. NRRL F-4474 TaxID=1463851 RepID=UPI003B635B8B